MPFCASMFLICERRCPYSQSALLLPTSVHKLSHQFCGDFGIILQMSSETTDWAILLKYDHLLFTKNNSLCQMKETKLCSYCLQGQGSCPQKYFRSYFKLQLHLNIINSCNFNLEKKKKEFCINYFCDHSAPLVLVFYFKQLLMCSLLCITYAFSSSSLVCHHIMFQSSNQNFCRKFIPLRALNSIFTQLCSHTKHPKLIQKSISLQIRGGFFLGLCQEQ